MVVRAEQTEHSLKRCSKPNEKKNVFLMLEVLRRTKSNFEQHAFDISTEVRYLKTRNLILLAISQNTILPPQKWKSTFKINVQNYIITLTYKSGLSIRTEGVISKISCSSHTNRLDYTATLLILPSFISGATLWKHYLIHSNIWPSHFDCLIYMLLSLLLKII